MTHEEIMSAVTAGAASNRNMPTARFPISTACVPEHEVQRFRRKLLVTLGDLPEDMTVAELRERLDEAEGGGDGGD